MFGWIYQLTVYCFFPVKQQYLGDVFKLIDQYNLIQKVIPIGYKL